MTVRKLLATWALVLAAMACTPTVVRVEPATAPQKPCPAAASPNAMLSLASVTTPREGVEVDRDDLQALATRAGATAEQVEAFGIQEKTYSRSELEQLAQALADYPEGDFVRFFGAVQRSNPQLKSTIQAVQFSSAQFGPLIDQLLGSSLEGETKQFEVAVKQATLSGVPVAWQRAFLLLSRAEAVARSRASARETCRNWVLELLARIRGDKAAFELDLVSATRTPLVTSRLAYLSIAGQATQANQIDRTCNDDLTACRMTYVADLSPAALQKLRTCDTGCEIGIELLVGDDVLTRTLSRKFIEIRNAPEE